MFLPYLYVYYRSFSLNVLLKILFIYFPIHHEVCNEKKQLAKNILYRLRVIINLQFI